METRSDKKIAQLTLSSGEEVVVIDLTGPQRREGPCSSLSRRPALQRSGGRQELSSMDIAFRQEHSVDVDLADGMKKRTSLEGPALDVAISQPALEEPARGDQKSSVTLNLANRAEVIDSGFRYVAPGLRSVGEYAVW